MLKENKHPADNILVFEQELMAPVSKVWKAITNKNEMKQWYFDLKEFKPEIGFRFEFSGGPSPERQYLHVCMITEAIPEKKLTYSWKYEGYVGISYVTFELFPQGENTIIKLTHMGLESFPAENPDFAIGNFMEGWNHIIHTSLKDHFKSK